MGQAELSKSTIVCTYIWHHLVLCDIMICPHEAGHFFFKDPLKIIQKLVFSYFLLHIPIHLWVEASENLIFRC